jgi:nicotinate-nucleotide adenylyltransferase
MKTFFFGTFNPIHNGHLKIASEVESSLGIDKVIFVPSFSPPHKKKDLASAEDRLNMLVLAVGRERVCDIEYHLKTPSYTCKTVEHLGKCRFIIGYDAFLDIENWKNPEYLREMLDFIVIPRKEHTNLSPWREKGYKFQVLPLDFMDISSENIRKYVQTGAKISDFVPEEIERYIYGNRLYQSLA